MFLILFNLKKIDKNFLYRLELLSELLRKTFHYKVQFNLYILMLSHNIQNLA